MADVTTHHDHGDRPPPMLNCPVGLGSLYPSRVLALRDLRTALGRDETTGDRPGNHSWIGLTLGLVVLDTLTGPGTKDVGKKWLRLLTDHGIHERDADAIYKLRCSMVHGYGIPLLGDGRNVQLTAYQHGYAVDTESPDVISVSVPVFCRCLVERVAYEAGDQWDETLIDTRARNLRRA